MSMRRVWPATLLVLALIASACGGGDDGDGAEADPDVSGSDTDATATSTKGAPDDEPSATSSPPLTATHTGVTADTITVGVTLLDMDGLRDSGLIPAGWGDQELVWDTYIDEINARGGINGRRLEAIIDFYSPVNTLGAEELCVRFSEDVEVFAVLGGFLGPAEPAMACLARNPELMLIGGVMSDEVLAQSEAAWFSGGRRRDRTIPIFLDLLDQDGRLQGRKVAIVTGDEQRLDTDNILLPELEARGIEVVVDATNDVVGTDIPAEDALWDIISERIRNSGADVIIINGDQTSAMRSITRNGLDQEVWAVDVGQLAQRGGSATSEDAHGIISISGLTGDESWDDPLAAGCRAIFTEAHPDIPVVRVDELGDEDEEWARAIDQACGTLPLFELLVTAAGPDLTPASVIAAAEGLGDFSLPSTPFASLGPGKPDASDTARLVMWDSTEGEEGAIVALTDLVDVTP